jgi:hypothetical protein
MVPLFDPFRFTLSCTPHSHNKSTAVHDIKDMLRIVLVALDAGVLSGCITQPKGEDQANKSPCVWTTMMRGEVQQ